MMKKIGLCVILVATILFHSLSFADVQTYNYLAFYFDTSLFFYQDSPYFQRTESLGLFDRTDIPLNSYDTGVFFKLRDYLSIGGSIMYTNNEVSFRDGDYGGKITLINTILSVPVRYHIRKRILTFSFGASFETLFLKKSYSLSTNINKDNNGNPNISDHTSGNSVGLGLLSSLDVHIGKKYSLFLEYWYHLALSIPDMNEYGDKLNPGGSTWAFGMRWWI